MTLNSSVRTVLKRIINTKEEMMRHEIARDYLDLKCNGEADVNIVLMLLSDKSEIIRSEAADYIINFGGIDKDILIDNIVSEKSEIVYPKLWLALAFQDGAAFLQIKDDLSVKLKSLLDRAYFDASAFISTGKSYFLYHLCAMACSDDFPASHTAVDLLALVASDRPELLRSLASDLEREHADNANKAKEIFLKS